MKFLITSHLPIDYTPTAEDIARAEGIHAFNADLEAAGKMVFAAGLMPAPYAKTVTPHPDGQVSVTDGPYMETKEHVGGFLIIEADDMEDALTWVRRGAQIGGRPIEVRQIFFVEQES